MIVDDEVLLRTTMVRMLAPRYEVEAAASARRALALLERVDVDLVVSDCSMPGMTGYDFHDALAQRRPHLARRLVFVSGSVSPDERPKHLRVVPLLAKPFTTEALRDFVAAALVRLAMEGGPAGAFAATTPPL